MAGVKYHVDIDFKVNGDAAAAAGEKLGKKAKETGDLWKETSRSMLDGFTGAMEKMGSMALSVGQAGVAGGVAAITYGVVELNKELETTTTSLAAVMKANDLGGGTVEGSMQAAAKWVAEMKKDARELPGEFEDLLGIVQAGAGTAFNLGLSPEKFEKMAAQAMAAAKALNVQMDQAGREFAQLMEGRAGAHNVFGMRLKIDAHSLYKDLDGVEKRFTELSKEGRARILEERLGAYGDSIKAFGNTYDAQSSTAVDNVKQLLQLGTQQLFGRVVNDLRELNDWFDENRGDLEAWAKSIGHDLVDLHDRLRRIAEEWGPLVKEFGENAYRRFTELWKEAEPYVARIAEHMKEFFKDKESIDKIITLLKLYVAAKVGQAAFGIAGMAGAAANLTGGVTGALGTQSAAALPAAAAAAVGVGLAIWQYEELQQDRARYAAEEWTNFRDYARNLSAGFESVSNEFGYINMASQEYQAQLAEITRNSGDAAGALYSFAVALQNAEADLKGFRKDKDAEIHDMVMDYAKDLGLDLAGVALAGKQLKDQDERKKKTEGKGTMTVNGNIYFTISSNQAPGQIAREVQRTMIEKKRFPTSSPHARNFGVARVGG